MREYYCIQGKRIRKVPIPEGEDLNKIQIGIPVKGDEAERVGLSEVGDIVLPSGIFGTQSRKNAYGYTYADKSKPKERRYVSTIWTYPFGNTNASEIAVDIYKQCYPKVEVSPYGIELQLFEDKNREQYVIVNCYVFNGDIQVGDSSRKKDAHGKFFLKEKCQVNVLKLDRILSMNLK
ncbi:hypothetical protein [[Clostridium] polysaccharolyticum]|uniref:Uncharacterized protein n=1 Tax=[Clostridium] polysaccharolyticum TaxID=29364 RepID=A0A1I0EUY5_9FIRM|nr:hypothetical protein [[Clostridium] polysaccharolyticum]SET49409.1 hypothetical protein SAMN04487772_12521 [[Clostridium] polysaccharolyticum]